MPKGEIYNRQEFADWVRTIRAESGMNAASFGASVIRFREKNGQLETVPYKRVAVSYWEKGEHLPAYPETIISLALLDYDRKKKRKYSENGSERLKYASDCLFYYAGKRLYCKNFRDLMLICAAKGMFELSEIPAVYNEMTEIIANDTEKADENQAKRYSLARDTDVLFSGLMEKKNREELKQEVIKNRHLYSIGYRVVGYRLQDLYEKKYRRENYNMDLPAAIRLYAPVYRDSFKKLTSYEIAVSRKWLIGLCVALHFQREDIDKVLSYAQYMPLEEEGTEGFVREYPECAAGTVDWFEKSELQYVKAQSLPDEGDFSVFLFPRIREFSERQKLIYLLGIGCYVLGVKDMPLPLHLFEYLPSRTDFARILEKAEADSEMEDFAGQLGSWIAKIFTDRMKNAGAAVGADIPGKDCILETAPETIRPLLLFIRKETEGLIRQIENPSANLIHEISNERYQDLIDEYHNYYDVDNEKLRLLKEKAVKKNMRQQLLMWQEDMMYGKYLTAIGYTLCTGYICKGQVIPEETAHFYRDNTSSETHKFMVVMRFFFELYLTERPVFPGPHGGILLKEGDRREMNFARMLLQLADCSK